MDVNRHKFQVHDQPDNPFSDAIEALVGEKPPLETQCAFDFNDLCESDKEWIQDWCSERASPHWATGLSMIEAAELIVAQAVENCNIRRMHPKE